MISHYFLDVIRERLEECNQIKWLESVQRESAKSKKGKNKLRTYRSFKSLFASECYVYTIMPHSHRSAMAQLRCGTAPLRIETGRYEGLKEEERICPRCPDAVESELHALIECPLYSEIRSSLFAKFIIYYDGFLCLSKEEQLKLFLGCKDEVLVRDCARACHSILTTRRNYLYQTV